MAIIELKKEDGCYCEEYGERAICVRFVGKRLKSRPKKIKVFFRTKNPKRPNWVKAKYKSRDSIVKIGPRSQNSLHWAANDFLKSNTELGGYFWFKIEPVE